MIDLKCHALLPRPPCFGACSSHVRQFFYPVGLGTLRPASARLPRASSSFEMARRPYALPRESRPLRSGPVSAEVLRCAATGTCLLRILNRFPAEP